MKISKYQLMLAGSLLLIVLVFIIAATMKRKSEVSEVLPIFGMDDSTFKPPVVKDFHLTNQAGVSITQNDVKNHIYVTNFFFAKCQGICPAMNKQLSRVYEKYRGNKEILFLSHSVKPDDDSVPALAEYAKLYNANPSQWWFLTGDKKQIYDLARYSYMASLSEGNGGPDDFVHTQMLTLVDKDKHLRGFYDGLDTAEVNKLIVDIQILLKEYH